MGRKLGDEVDGGMDSGRTQLQTWLFWPALLPDANGEVVGSVHTAFTVSQVFAAPLGSRPDVQADQGCPPKASRSFTWEWGLENSKVPGTQLHTSPTTAGVSHPSARAWSFPSLTIPPPPERLPLPTPEVPRGIGSHPLHLPT